MKENKNEENLTHFMPIFMSIGIGVGVAIGAAMDNIPAFMCIGLGIGLCIGTAIDAKNRAKSENKEEIATSDESKE